NPRLPAVIPGGSPHNPMGPRALTLSGGGEYAIHGTNRPSSIGTFASYGCIRMYNQDILDLFGRVSVGTPVVVTLGTAEAASRPRGTAIPAVTSTDMSKSDTDRRARPTADGAHSRPARLSSRWPFGHSAPSCSRRPSRRFHMGYEAAGPIAAAGSLWTRTFAVLTTESNELVAEVHDRMPVILKPEDYDRWLGNDPDPRDL